MNVLDSLFSALTLALSQRYLVALSASFAWGILSVLLSPCHLSAIPLLIGYISRHCPCWQYDQSGSTIS